MVTGIRMVMAWARVVVVDLDMHPLPQHTQTPFGELYTFFKRKK